MITGEFHGEVKARTKALWMAMFFLAFLWLPIKVVLGKQDGGSLASRLHQIVFPESAMDRGVRNHFERGSFQCYLLEDA